MRWERHVITAPGERLEAVLATRLATRGYVVFAAAAAVPEPTLLRLADKLTQAGWSLFTFDPLSARKDEGGPQSDGTAKRRIAARCAAAVDALVDLTGTGRLTLMGSSQLEAALRICAAERPQLVRGIVIGLPTGQRGIVPGHALSSLSSVAFFSVASIPEAESALLLQAAARLEAWLQSEIAFS